MRSLSVLLLLLAMCACGRVGHLGKEPEFSTSSTGGEYQAMISAPIAGAPLPASLQQQASLWSGTRNSLLGDRRAGQQGDILTVVIEIDEKAEISNSTERSRSGSESLAISDFFGLPQRLNRSLPDGSSLGNAVGTSSSSASEGDGSVSRREKLELRVAATVVGIMPNGVFRIEGTQEVRVNFELRELIVSGFVRPEDISRQNEITYDKIASARISYGGRGQITDVQQPRYGQQIVDMILPF